MIPDKVLESRTSCSQGLARVTLVADTFDGACIRMLHATRETVRVAISKGGKETDN